MNLYVKRGLRRALKHCSMGCYVFLLALSVFGWGLHSKLSLYECNTGSQASTPIAKLLSDQERAPEHRMRHVDAKPAQLHIVVLYVAPPPRPAEFFGAWRDVLTIKPVAFAFDGPSLLRPPPYSVA
jgi:hypothetical protein